MATTKTKTKTKAKGKTTKKKGTRGRTREDLLANPPNPSGKGLPSNNEILIDDPDEKRQLVSRLLNETMRTYKMPKVHSDEELEQRIAEYFTSCAQTGEKPSVEQLCQCTGYVYATLWDWEHGRRPGFSPRTAEIIKRGKEFIRVFDAKLLLEGAVNPVAYIFRAKNYYGMKDQQDVVVTPNQPMGPAPDPEQLAADYLTADYQEVPALPDAEYPTLEEVKS